MEVKTSELTGVALDWAVAKCENFAVIEDVSLPCYPILVIPGEEDELDDFYTGYSPSTDWSQGGPIIERENVSVLPSQSLGNSGDELTTENWYAEKGFDRGRFSARWRELGHTPLIAAMRCFVSSKLGDEVDIPKELLICPPPNH